MTTRYEETRQIFQQAANKMADKYSELGTKLEQANARIEELESILAVILSTPAIRDVEEQRTKNLPSCANPITDARVILNKKYS